MTTNVDGSLDDDGGPMIVLKERDGDQALWIRVGPVYTEDAQEHEPGIWISYQEHHMAAGLQGPLLLTPRLWAQLKTAIDERINSWHA